MKKVLALILVILMVFGLGVHAFAEEVSFADKYMLPELAEGSSEIVIIYGAGDQNLSEEDQKLMEEAHEKLKDEVGLGCRYFCMVDLVNSDDSVTLVFEPITGDTIQVKQYLNGAWTVIDHVINEDGTITVEGVVDGTIAIFVPDAGSEEGTPSAGNKRDSAGATAADLLPGISQKSLATVLLHSTDVVPHLSEEIQNQMADAKEKLKGAGPDGFAVKYFCYAELLGSASSATVEFEKMDFNEIHFYQFINGEWEELSYAVNADGFLAVENVVEGPLAIFVK